MSRKNNLLKLFQANTGKKIMQMKPFVPINAHRDIPVGYQIPRVTRFWGRGRD